jgi:hypothetical protein
LYTGTLIKDLFTSVERAERTAELHTAISASEIVEAGAAEKENDNAISVGSEAE